MYDVVIIGAGVVGGMLMHTLAKYDLKICTVDKANDVATGATRANSAIVHAGFDAEEGTLKASLNVKGSEMMPEIAKDLGVKYKNNGALVIGFDENDRKILEMLYARGEANGVKNLKLVEKEELKNLEENISDDAICALYAPTSAIICPYELTIAAIGNAMDNGAELKLNFEVSSIKYENGIYEISSGKEILKAKYVVNAAGLYSDKIARMIGDNSFEITPRKGEYILLDKECGSLASQTIFKTPSKMGKGILVSPTVDGNLLAGPTSVNIENKENNATTADGFSDIMRQASGYINGIPFGKTITSFCGLRAVGNTGDFIITSPKEGFINAAGIESPGLSASPAIAVYIADMLKKQGLNLTQKTNYIKTRKPMHYFREASIEEKNRIIKENPSFGKIICRCETVSEGEILEAIRTNPKPTDLDGVKRRTRAQMGRCQGGFCMPYITEILAKEMNVPFESITKSGGKSLINVSKTKEVILP